MSMQDPVSNMIAAINNASKMSKAIVKCPHSNLKEAILSSLKDEGYIENFAVETQDGKKVLAIFLKYYEGQPVISQLSRYSRPSCRRYRSKNALPKVIGGYGVAIVSTSKGVISDAKARALGVGGEVLCVVF